MEEGCLRGGGGKGDGALRLKRLRNVAQKTKAFSARLRWAPPRTGFLNNRFFGKGVYKRTRGEQVRGNRWAGGGTERCSQTRATATDT